MALCTAASARAPTACAVGEEPVTVGTGRPHRPYLPLWWA
ncbi:hypothetical protein T261_0983 [Streptomyces lydicus]|nr:hypothetical protein T261_0983 [Streptomyces lydicus]